MEGLLGVTSDFSSDLDSGGPPALKSDEKSDVTPLLNLPFTPKRAKGAGATSCTFSAFGSQTHL